MNRSHGTSIKKETSILVCLMIGIVFGFFGFLPAIMMPSDSECQNYYDDVQGCMNKSHQIKESLKPLPPIGFGFGFFGSYVIQWKFGQTKNEIERRTPI